MSLSASRQQVTLVDLPHATLYAILHRAGPRSRELCRALLDVYGPLHRLTPRGVSSIVELLSALTKDSRHRHLRVLDLSHVDQLVTNSSLPALCEALPNLRTLRLHSSTLADTAPDVDLPAIAAATSHLRCLEALHAPHLVCSAASTEHTLGWSRLQELTLPASFATPGRPLTALQPCTRLSKLRFERLGRGHFASFPAQLPALAALELCGYAYRINAADLRGLTGLTALKLVGVDPGGQATASSLQQQLGALGNLRSLELGPWNEDTCNLFERAWLSRLTLLTRLQVAFSCSPWGIAPCGCVEVASSVPRLPALRELHITNCFAGDGGELSVAAWDGVAASCSALRLLHLGRVTLARNMPQALSQLTGLTCLRLLGVRFNDQQASFSWLTSLASLRELSYFEHVADGAVAPAIHVLPCELLASLGNVDTLSLPHCAFVDGPYVEQLCATMLQLTSLDLSGGHIALAAAQLPALQRLTILQVLGLEGFAIAHSALESLRVPASLRRCYLGRGWQRQKRAAARQVLGGHVEAVFDRWERWL